MATLKVEREAFTSSKDKKEYYDYIVKSVLRGRVVEAHLIPKNKDFSGYAILDLIFDIAPTAELIIKDEETETQSGAIAKYKTYTVQNTDENGDIFSYNLKPRYESDKSILNILLQQAIRTEQAAEEVKA